MGSYLLLSRGRHGCNYRDSSGLAISICAGAGKHRSGIKQDSSLSSARLNTFKFRCNGNEKESHSDRKPVPSEGMRQTHPGNISPLVQTAVDLAWSGQRQRELGAYSWPPFQNGFRELAFLPSGSSMNIKYRLVEDLLGGFIPRGRQRRGGIVAVSQEPLLRNCPSAASGGKFRPLESYKSFESQLSAKELAHFAHMSSRMSQQTRIVSSARGNRKNFHKVAGLFP